MINYLRRKFGKERRYYQFVKRIFECSPHNLELYKLALVHRSASVTIDNGQSINNERLEFLGDAVIEAIVSEMIFIDYADKNEGALTQLRSRIVSRATLNKIALDLRIDEEIIANPASLNFNKQNIFGDAFEALIGALYLDRGYNHTNRTLIRIIRQRLDVETMTHTERDFKSRIIEWCQKYRKKVEFVITSNSSPDEITPTFHAELKIEDEIAGTGSGRSKKEAEQEAAQMFYETHADDFESNPDK